MLINLEKNNNNIWDCSILWSIEGDKFYIVWLYIFVVGESDRNDDSVGWDWYMLLFYGRYIEYKIYNKDFIKDVF